MTPRKCSKHELRDGEIADEKYWKNMVAAMTCWRCRLWAYYAIISYHYHQLLGHKDYL